MQPVVNKQDEVARRTYGLAPPEFRLPDAARVGAVRLQVTDLQRSVEYYEHVLGLRVHACGSDTVSLGAGSGERPLVHLHTARGVAPPRRGAFGLYHFAVLLPERSALGRFAAHLTTLGVRVGTADHLVSEALYLSDPDGLGIEVYADRPRDTWRAREGELVMATEPLDVANLVASAGGRRWEGMPTGTVIGHVHLHVGGLDDAESFYHAGLGFDKTVWSYPGALFLAAGGYHHHLGTNVWSQGPAAMEHEARLLEWELLVPDVHVVAAAAGSLGAAGYLVEPAAETSGHTFTAADPWGTRLRVAVPRSSV